MFKYIKKSVQAWEDRADIKRRLMDMELDMIDIHRRSQGGTYLDFRNFEDKMDSKVSAYLQNTNNVMGELIGRIEALESMDKVTHEAIVDYRHRLTALEAKDNKIKSKNKVIRSLLSDKSKKGKRGV